jgi:hypothetical protein
MFAPRVGLAYRLTTDTVFRAGYGVAITPEAMLGPGHSGYPSNIQQTYPALQSRLAAGTLETGIPAFSGPPAGVERWPWPVEVAVTKTVPDSLVRPYIQSWNAVLERRLPTDTVVSVGYVATAQRHLRGGYEQNYSPIGAGDAGRYLAQRYGRVDASGVFRPKVNGISYANGNFNSNYQSMQVSITRRAADGLTLKGAYTWAHSISRTGSYIYPGMEDRNVDQGDGNLRHNFQMGWLWDLPFGGGRRYFNSGVGSKILGGWQINGIFSSVTGTFFGVSASSTSLNTAGAGGQTADQVKAGKVQKIGTTQEFYDKTAFAPVTRSTRTIADWGNTRGAILQGPGQVNLDASLFRTFRLTEKIRTEFRAEGFNVTNTPKFSNPSGDVNSANFMRITSVLGGQFAQDGPARALRFALRFTF